MLLLAIIYLGYIAFGLPDPLFGSVWPVLQHQFDLPVSYAGFITTTVSVCTIISSLLSDRVNRKMGTGLVTATSIALTAVALFGFSVSTNIWMMVLFAVPLGLGAGGVDAALNNYMALHYSSKHMSWLHCFWGVGASISPYIMSYWLGKELQWEKAYITVGILLSVIVVILFASLPLWKKTVAQEQKTSEPLRFKDTFRIRGVKETFSAFFVYCAIEGITFAWTSSYLVSGRGMSEEMAARYALLFYLGMTVGRMITGFFADRVGDKNMIRLGCGIGLAAVIMIFIPLDSYVLALIGLFFFGFGCGPVFPAIMHSTPEKFGADKSQAIVGIEMAFGYAGSTFMPPLFGVMARYIGMGVFPVLLCVFTVLTVVLTENLNRKTNT